MLYTFLILIVGVYFGQNYNLPSISSIATNTWQYIQKNKQNNPKNNNNNNNNNNRIQNSINSFIEAISGKNK
jgi:hypothetical protein